MCTVQRGAAVAIDYALIRLLELRLAKATRAVLKAWLREPQRGDGNILFPNARGGQLSVHGVQYLLNKHRRAAANTCPSLMQKRVRERLKN